MAVFSDGRPDFAAPKNNSPSATAGMNTSGARSRLDNPASSPSSSAITISVSSKNLPLAGVHPLALLLNRLTHLLGGNGVQGR